MMRLAAKAKDAEKSAARSSAAKNLGDDSQAASKDVFTLFSGFPVQRKAECACGGDCPRCQDENPNLPVSEPSDASEIEADAMADKVMRMSADRIPADQSKKKVASENSAPVRQAKKEGDSSANIESGGKFSQSGGQSLDGATRNFMQSRFGADFSRVKIHTGDAAAQMSREVNAKAFTIGSHIYFNKGEFQPQTNAGKHLLAHELTHVTQQRKAGSAAQNNIQRKSAAPLETITETTVETPVAPSTRSPVNSSYDENLSFRFRSDTDIPAAARGESDSEFMIWCVKSAFKIIEPIARRIVNFVGWQPVSNTRTYKKGEFITFTLAISGVVQTYKILASEGIVSEKAVQKFEEIIAVRAQMNTHDRTFFDKTVKNIYSNLDVGGFTVNNLDKIKTEVQTFIADKESVLRPLGLLDDYFRAPDVARDLDFEELKDRLFNKKAGKLTKFEKEQILALFGSKALHKVFVMLETANTVAKKELKRYSANPQDLADLINLLTSTYKDSYTEADLLRVQAINRFINTYQDHLRNVPGGSATNNFRQILELSMLGDDALLQSISQMPADNIEYQISNFFADQMIQSRIYKEPLSELRKKGDLRVRSEFPEFESANKKDAGTNENLKNKSTEQYPILYDVSLDFRSLSRLPKSELATKILEELRSKQINSEKTQRYLTESPGKIWEFEPLMRRLMFEEGISKDDVIGKVVHDKIESIKDHKFWRSIAIAALGLAMGIAGFFTGGATWAGLALIAGSMTLNLLDLHYELQDYALHSAAAEATLEGGLTNAPSSIGVIFALGGLVLDFIDVLKFLKPITKTLTSAEDVAKYADELFGELKTAGKLKDGITKELFVKELVENWKKREKMVADLLPEVKAIVESDAFKSLHQGVQEGLFRVFDHDREAFTHLTKTFAAEPEILTRLGKQAMINPKAAENIAELHKFVKKLDPLQLDEVMRYYGSVGELAIHNLPEVLDVLRRGNISLKNPELTKLILTNRNLQQSLLKNSTEPDLLLRQWEHYQTKIAGLPPDGAPDFVKFLDEQNLGTRLAETSGGVAQKIELAVENIQITAQLGEKDLKLTRDLIQKLVKEKGFISAEQMQAIIRTAEAAETHLAGTVSKNLRGFIYQLNNASSRITKVGMKQDNLFALLRGLENGDEFSTALKLVDHINSGASGLKTVDDILSSITISNLDAILKFDDAAVELGDVYAVASKISVASNAEGELVQLAALAGESAGKSFDVRRLRNILESLGEGPYPYETVEKAIAEANVFDQKVAKALAESEGGLEDLTRLVWGEKGLKKTGSDAVKAVFGNPEKAEKLIKGVMNGTEIDPVKWAVLRKTIDNASIPQTIKNNIIGELWARAGIESYASKGYSLVKREVPISLRSSSMSKAVTANADAVMKKGDEIFVLEFKSGDAVFSEAQETIYPLIKNGEFENLRIANPVLEEAIRTNPGKVKFIEVREPYNF